MLTQRKDIPHTVKVGVSVLFMMCFVQDAFAFGMVAASGGSELASTILGVRNALFKILKGILILAGAGSLAFSIYNLMEGNREAAKRLGIWFVGLLIGFIIISIFKNLGASTAAGSLQAGGFASTKYTVKSTIEAVLIIVCMVTSVRGVITVINGEQGGSRQLFKWFAVSLIGFAILGAV